MIRKATEGYPMIPEGEQVLRIAKVDESDYAKFDKITIYFEDANGTQLKSDYNFVKDDGTPNVVAEGVYTRVARAALNDQTLDEIDSSLLQGCYICAEVVHNEGSKGGKFANLKKIIGSANCFDKKSTAAPKKPDTPSPAAPKRTAAEILAAARAKAGSAG